MNFKSVLLAAFIFAAGCKKGDDKVAEKAPGQLLTQKEWILEATGFDDNKNGILDSSENNIQDCQKDNSYVFNQSGAGHSFDNTLLCGGQETIDFNWQLLNNGAAIKINDQLMYLLKLNEEELILSPDLPVLTVSFIMICRH